MNFFVWLMTNINFYLGFRYFLNAVHILHSSKVSKSATIAFAVLFLCMGIVAVYICLYKNNYKLALLISIGPWAIALLMLLLNMLFGNYQ